MGVTRAVANVNSVLLPAISGMRPDDQAALDECLREIDGTPMLTRLGANAILAVSLSWALAVACNERVDFYRSIASDGDLLLPLPMVNILSGGAHAGRALDIQDVLVVPLAAQSFSEAIQHAWRVRKAAVDIAAAEGMLTSLVADEGGLGVAMQTNRRALELVTAAIEAAGFEPGDDVGIAVDLAANQLQNGSGYRFGIEGRDLSSAALVNEVAEWCRDFPIVSVEDPLSDQDWAGWATATERLGNVQLIGDDLFATNPQTFSTGVDRQIANAVLLKPNQAGCLTRASEVCGLAATAGYARIVSARSGDTEDSWLADLAVGWCAGQIKVGSLTRSERTAKWNRLLEIEAREGRAIRYAGATSLGGSQSRTTGRSL